MSAMTPNEQQKDTSIDDDAELYALEQLLSVGESETKQPEVTKETPKTPTTSVPRLREDSTFADAFSYSLEDLPASKLKQVQDEAANKLDDFDSSDDEEVKNFLERKYNEYGNGINKALKQQRVAKYEAEVTRDVSVLSHQSVANAASLEQTKQPIEQSLHIKNPHNPIERHSRVSANFRKAPKEHARNVPESNATTTAESSGDKLFARASAKPFNTLNDGCAIFTDPVFGMRMVNPLVSSAVLIERMSGRKAIPFSGVALHTQRGDLTKDWVIAGVLVHKNPTKLTKKGDPYSVWRLSDLKGDIKMISLFLFRGAHKELWKTTSGTCLAILNPTVFEQRADRTDAACLSIDTAKKVMVLGQSKDMGVCKAQKKNGEPCTAIINRSECDYCIFHMKQEFSKMSQRSELQSANAGRGLNELRNKVLGKHEVFYGGQSFSAIPAKKSAKQTAKDSNRLMSLSEYAVSPNAAGINHAAKPKSVAPVSVPYAARGGPTSKLAANVELSTKQRLKDLERLKILQAAYEKPAIENTTPSAPTSPSTEKPMKPSSSSLSSPALLNAKKSITTASPSTQAPKTTFSTSSPSIQKSCASPSTSSATQKSKETPASSLPSTPKLDALKSRLANVTAATQKSPSTAKKSPATFSPVPEKFKDKSFSFASASPQLSRENFSIEVNIGDRNSSLAKLKAMQVLKKKPIEKVDPNSTRGSTVGKKRAIDELNARFDSASKRQRIDEEQREIERKTRIQRIMDATSTHTNLIDMREQQERDQYFFKLEKKEALEEKMLNTFKVPCKAVICQRCKYTAFSAADRCKEEKHPLKVVDAEKRFFQCKDCGNRTASVFKLPKTSCNNCKGSRWQRAAMIRERKICDGRDELSVRGDEETFLGSLAGKASLNLMVPDE